MKMKFSLQATLAVVSTLSAATTISSTSAFVPIQTTNSVRASISSSSSAGRTALAAQIPTISGWEVKRNGSLTGIVRNHPSIANGDVITTSALDANVASNLKENQMVSTKSGSQYRLGKAAVVAVPVPVPAKDGIRSPAAPKPVAAVKKTSPPPVLKKSPKAPDLPTRLQQAKSEYNLNGKSVGDGKYLLVGQKLKSTSIRSDIYYAYQADSKTGLPTGPRLTVKLSQKLESLERENNTYNKVAGGLFYRDNFVRKIDYLPDAQGGRGFASDCGALVLESGERTLRAVCDLRKNKGLEGKAMRQAAVSLVQCVQAMQFYGLVWTDLKAENFVVVSNSIGDGSIQGIKAIDLESAVKAGSPSLDFSPEACPPEFALAVSQGRGSDFIVNYEYDSWSFGMLLYELAVGKSYWAGKGDSAITQLLKVNGFEVDISAVQDDKLRDLIGKCLATNPKQRVKIAQILFHPYFLTTGIGPISF